MDKSSHFKFLIAFSFLEIKQVNKVDPWFNMAGIALKVKYMQIIYRHQPLPLGISFRLLFILDNN